MPFVDMGDQPPHALVSRVFRFARTASAELRYCQGMNFLGGTLLRVFESAEGADATVVDAATDKAFRGLLSLVAPLHGTASH